MTLALLQAMYPLPSELILDPETETYLNNLTSEPLPPDLIFTLRLNVDEDETYPLEVIYHLSTSTSTPKLDLVIRQPPWLNRSSTNILSSSLVLPATEEGASPSETILSSIEILKSTASTLLHSSRPLSPPLCISNDSEKKGIAEEEGLERVWFWFPSLSSKEKRRDLVEYAPRYDLTGFVLAGMSVHPDPNPSRKGRCAFVLC